LQAAEKPKRVTPKPPQAVQPASTGTRKTSSSEEQDQALYEWQQDIRYSNNSRTVEQFLQKFPVGSHVPDAERKLSELRALGQ
jgi:hypothetical protein